jgi:NAD(P)-dependent dehydrogenase (short-subunit alcohol dehydrogenase family)
MREVSLIGSLFDLVGKKALIIGGDGNLGPIWKETLQEAGATVYTIGLPQFDFTVYEDLEAACAAVKSAIETPDIIVCNAAIDTPPTKKEARFFTNFIPTLQVNLIAHALILKRLLPAMVSRGSGTVVLIGSIQGYVGADWRNYSGGFEKPVAYNVSKAALQQLARSITVQYGRYGIRAVCPGFGPVLSDKLPEDFCEKIREKIPTRRTVSKRSLQQTLLYACCCEELAGEDWLVDGGFTKW